MQTRGEDKCLWQMSRTKTLRTKYTSRAKGGEEDACIEVKGDVLRFDSGLRAGGAIGRQEADATVTPELEVPVPGIMQHFSSKEQEEVRISFLALCRTVEAARHIKVMKGWHAPHFDISGVAIENSYSPCYHQVIPWACFALCFSSGPRESCLSYFPVSHNLGNISKRCL